MICRTAVMAALHSFSSSWRPTEIGSVDADDIPVRCHWEFAKDEDRCELVFQIIRDSWAAQIEEAGFRAPLPDDDGLLDIYLSNDETYGGAWTLGPYRDEDPDDGRRGCSAYMAVDPSLSDDDLPIFISHEFNHVLQYGMDFEESTLPIWEAVASAAEVWTYPDWTNEVYVVKDFQNSPWLGILGDSYSVSSGLGVGTFYEYGAVVWIHHLESLWGDGHGAGGSALWRAAEQDSDTNEPDVLDAYDAVTGDWQAALVDLSIQRTRIGTENPPDWLDWMGTRGKVAVEATIRAEDLPLDVVPEVGPYQTGVVYVTVEGIAAGETVSITASSDSETEWAVLAVEGEDSGWMPDTTMEWTGSGGNVTFGVVNLAEPGWDADKRLRQTEVTLSFARVESDPGDTGDTGDGDTASDDTGGDDTGGGSGEGGDGQVDGDGDLKGGGCGCATGSAGGSAAGLALIGLLALARRRED